jgi:NAD(P)-dependent dehydrogenase (short-subunit alcohol dehydrogenase family)
MTYALWIVQGLLALLFLWAGGIKLVLPLLLVICGLKRIAEAGLGWVPAVARHMARKGSGVILTLSTPGSRLPGPGYIGFGVACAAIEAVSRHLAGELGPRGTR